ncbi:UNVERIFIED_CONTAM: hypothetical protein HDU68_009412 [Siphonaria sp. JEL0065]|nr:hypothetical protein HDU68_009412 [Siphonaria sp. JEL0065]
MSRRFMDLFKDTGLVEPGSTKLAKSSAGKLSLREASVKSLQSLQSIRRMSSPVALANAPPAGRDTNRASSSSKPRLTVGSDMKTLELGNEELGMYSTTNLAEMPKQESFAFQSTNGTHTNLPANALQLEPAASVTNAISNAEPAAPPAPSQFTCLWAIRTSVPCLRNFTDPDVFYAHLAEEHVGRKSHGNLTLNCLWMNCGHGDRPFSKRDHIVSHCRAHVPFKANICSDCRAQFKWWVRPQDLKKHCLKQNHTFIEPSARVERPGPPTTIVDQETGASMVREGPRLTGGTRKPGRGRSITLMTRVIPVAQKPLHQDPQQEKQGHSSIPGSVAPSSALMCPGAGSSASALDALLQLANQPTDFHPTSQQPVAKIQYQQSQHYQPQHLQNQQQNQQQLQQQYQQQQQQQLQNYDEPRLQQQQLLDLERKQLLLNQQQQELNQQREMQQQRILEQRYHQSQQQQFQQQPLSFIPQSPSLQNKNAQQQRNSLQALLNTPIPQQVFPPFAQSPTLFNTNTHNQQPQPQFKKPAPPGTPLHLHSMNASISSSLTTNSKPKTNQAIHSLLMQSPSFSHVGSGAGGKSPMVGTPNLRKHPYQQSQQRKPSNNANNKISSSNNLINNALLGMLSPVAPHLNMTPSMAMNLHQQQQQQQTELDGFSVGGLVTGAASPFVRGQQDQLMRQMQERQLMQTQFLQQQQNRLDAQTLGNGFIGNALQQQQFFAGASVLNSPAFGPIGTGFGMTGSIGGVGDGDAEADILAVDGLLSNGMGGGGSASSFADVSTLTSAYGSIGGEFHRGEFGSSGGDALF